VETLPWRPRPPLEIPGAKASPCACVPTGSSSQKRPPTGFLQGGRGKSLGRSDRSMADRLILSLAEVRRKAQQAELTR
jgi:hypothetical protein